MLSHKIRRYVSGLALRAMQRVRIAWYRLLSGNRIEGAPVLSQPLQAMGMGSISFERDVKIGFFPSPYFLNSYAYIEARNPGSKVHIGSGTWINNGFSCIAEHTSITIGRNCRIGIHVEMADSDFHGLDPHARETSDPLGARPVVVEDDVFIGSNVKILKGVRVGAGAVIANSSLVVSDVPAMTVAGGVPAKVIRTLG